MNAATDVRPASPAQLSFLRKLLAERGIAEDAIRDPLEALSLREASQAIDEIKSQPRPSRTASPVQSQLKPKPASRPALRDGTYTVDMGDGTWVTLQLSSPTWARGSQVLAYLCGSDNELSYAKFAYIDGISCRIMAKQRHMRDDGFGRQVAAWQMLATGDVDAAHERFLQKAEAYAMQSEKCLRCCRLLTVPASVARGLGPVCGAIELGW